MKILDNCVGLLTNREVLQVLKDKAADRSDSTTAHPSERKVYEYLKNSITCPPVGAASLDEFQKAAEAMKLKGTEILQLINLEPRAPIDVFVAVDQCEERLGEERVQGIMELARGTFVSPEQQ